MKRLLALPLLALVHCATQPAPAPTPTPAPVTRPAAATPRPPLESPQVQARPGITRYTLTGVMESINECTGTMTSQIAMNVVLTNGEHSMPSSKRVIGTMGRSFHVALDWPDAWGRPTEWQDLQVTNREGDALCGNPTCDGGKTCRNATVISPSIPVAATETLTVYNFDLHCTCAG